MTPFGLFLQELRRERRLAQKQLACMLALDPSYLSGLESGRKGAPPLSLILRLKDVLSLSEKEAGALHEAIEQSRRKIEIPLEADPAEYAMAHRLVRKLGNLRPAQVRAIDEILSI